MDWSELADAQPRLAALGHRRLLDQGVVCVGTIRADGTPRLSPVEPSVLDGVLWLSMLWRSTKAADLRRDPRILVHSVITSRDGGEGEFKIRGRAIAEHDRGVQSRDAAAAGPRLRSSRPVGHKPSPAGKDKPCHSPSSDDLHAVDGHGESAGPATVVAGPLTGDIRG